MLKTGNLIIGPHRPAPQRGRKAFRLSLILIALGLIIARVFFFEMVIVRGNTMAPTALEGDVFLVHRSRIPTVGDVVLVDTDDAGPVLRRILGQPGDTLQTEDGRLIRNGQPVEARRVGSFVYQEPGEVEADMPPRRQHFIRESLGGNQLYHVLGDHIGNVKPWALSFDPITVPDQHYFILCDNRPICPEGAPGLTVQASDISGVVGVPLMLGGARVDAPEKTATEAEAQ